MDKEYRFIKYEDINKYGIITISYSDLIDKKKLTKIASNDIDVLEKFHNLMNKILMLPQDKIMLYKAPIKQKWIFLKRHEEEIKNLVDFSSIDQNSQGQSEMQIQVQNCIEKATPVSVQNFQRFLQQDATPQQWDEFFSTRCLSKILNTLEQYEINARSTKNILVCQAFLEFIQFLLKREPQSKYMNEIAKIPNSFKIILLNLNPIQLKNSNIIYDIICGESGFLWESDIYLEYFLEALGQYKTEFDFTFRFEGILLSLFLSENIILIKKTLQFLYNVLASILDPKKTRIIQSEIENTYILEKKIEFKEILKAIEQRIKNNQYNIEDCTFQTYQEKMMKYNNFSQMMKQSKFLKIGSVNNRINQYKQLAAPIIKNFGFAGFNKKGGKNEKVEEEQKLQVQQIQFQDESERQEINRLFLDPHEVTLFDKNKNEVLDLINKIVNINIEVGQEHIENDFVYNSQEVLEKLKDEALKNDSYDQFLVVMNKLLKLISREQVRDQQTLVKLTSEQVKGQWTLVDESISKVIQRQFETHKDIIENIDIDTLKNELNISESQVRELAKKSSQTDEELLIINQQRNELDLKLSEIQKELKNLKQENIELKMTKNTEIAQFHNKIIQINQEKKQFQEQRDILIQQTTIEIDQLKKQLQSLQQPMGDQSISPTLIEKENYQYQQQQQINNQINAPPAPPAPPAPLAPPGPPAPPKMGSGPIPPPPPPPLALNTLKGAPPPPPPPPGVHGALPSMPVQQVGKTKQNPRVPMKNIMWTQVTEQNIKDTIWTKVDDLKVPLDKDYLEQEFSKVVPKLSDQSVVTGARKIEATKVILLPAEKSKTIELILGKLRISNEVISQSLISCDPKILTLANLESFEIIAPTDDEVSVVKSFDGDKSLLGNPEKFVDEISNVQGYIYRIKALKFSKLYIEMFNLLELQMQQFSGIFKELQNDDRIRVILEYSLAVGNYLNGTTTRGGAYGFKLDNIEKLMDIKTSDNKKNLLMYVIELSENKVGQIFIDIEKYEILKIPITQLTGDLNEIKKGAKIMLQAIQSQTDNQSDLIKEQLDLPYKMINDKILIIEQMNEEIKEAFQKTAKFYCENPAEASDRFGEKILKFWISILKAKKEMKIIDDNQRRQTVIQPKLVKQISTETMDLRSRKISLTQNKIQ